ncbi:MAG: hypothetical protein AAF927_26750 [Bacteroidota bacterium]
MRKQVKVLFFSHWVWLFMLFLPTSGIAQGFFWGHSGYVMMGPSQLSLPGMNQFLEREGYPLINERPFSMELGFSIYRQNWVMGATMNNFMSAQSRFLNTNQALLSLNYQYINLHIGHILFRKDVDFAVYPTVGFAGGGAVLKYQPLGTRFPQNYWTAGAFVNGAINFSWFRPISDAPIQRIHMGLSIGYNRSLESISNSWRIKNLAADQLIPVEPTGPYIKLIFGMGKVRRRY